MCAGFGAANELFEFLSALRFEDSYAGDLTNAGWDLAFNAGGALTAALTCGLLGVHEPTANVRLGSLARPVR